MSLIFLVILEGYIWGGHIRWHSSSITLVLYVLKQNPHSLSSNSNSSSWAMMIAPIDCKMIYNYTDSYSLKLRTLNVRWFSTVKDIVLNRATS